MKEYNENMYQLAKWGVQMHTSFEMTHTQYAVDILRQAIALGIKEEGPNSALPVLNLYLRSPRFKEISSFLPKCNKTVDELANCVLDAEPITMGEYFQVISSISAAIGHCYR